MQTCYMLIHGGLSLSTHHFCFHLQFLLGSDACADSETKRSQLHLPAVWSVLVTGHGGVLSAMFSVFSRIIITEHCDKSLTADTTDNTQAAREKSYGNEPKRKTPRAVQDD